MVGEDNSRSRPYSRWIDYDGPLINRLQYDKFCAEPSTARDEDEMSVCGGKALPGEGPLPAADPCHSRRKRVYL